MLRYAGVLLLGLLAATPMWADPSGGREAAEKVIDRGIASWGGPKQVARLQSVKFRGRCTLYLGNQAVSYTGVFAYRYPNCNRNEVATQLGGQVHCIVKVIQSDQGYQRIDENPATSINQGVLRSEQIRLRQCYYETLLPLRDKEVTLRLLGAAEVAGRKAVAVQFTVTGLPDEALFFDEQSGLLVKSEVKQAKGPLGQLRVSEMHFLDYQEADGVRYPSRVVTYIDGVKTAEMEMSEFTPGVTHAPGAFLWP